MQQASPANGPCSTLKKSSWNIPSATRSCMRYPGWTLQIDRGETWGGRRIRLRQSTLGRAVLQLRRTVPVGCCRRPRYHFDAGRSLRQMRRAATDLTGPRLTRGNAEGGRRTSLPTADHFRRQGPGQTQANCRRSASAPSGSTRPLVVGRLRMSSPAGNAAHRIARELVLNPELIVCAKPVSASTVSIPRQILNMRRR